MKIKENMGPKENLTENTVWNMREEGNIWGFEQANGRHWERSSHWRLKAKKTDGYHEKLLGKERQRGTKGSIVKNVLQKGHHYTKITISREKTNYNLC